MVGIQRGLLVIALGFSMLGVSPLAHAQKAAATLIAADDLSLLPADSEFVGGVDFAQLKTSVLWKQYVAPALARSDIQAQLNDLEARCHVNLTQVVTRISFGFSMLSTNTARGVLVVHGVPKAKIVTCLRSATQGKTKISDDVTIDGDVIIVRAKDGSNVGLSFVDASTAMIVVGPQATSDGMKQIAMTNSGLTTSPAFIALYKQTTTADTLWMLINGNAKALDSLKSIGITAKVIFGSLSVAHDVNVDLRVRVAAAEQATQLAASMQPEVRKYTALFDKLVVTGDGPDVRIEIRASDAKLKVLMSMVAPTKPAVPDESDDD